ADAAPEQLRRALTAVWDGADEALLAHLRATRFTDREVRLAALVARARAGDATALDDWLADAELDASTTAGSLGLALGPPAATRARLEALRDRYAEGSPERARLEAMRALAILK